MAELIDITQNILSQNTIQFETNPVNKDIVPNLLENGKFGILNFVAVTSDETKDELDFLFTIDCSGSMSDKCADSRSKMQHIIHTLKNMVLFFKDHPNIGVYITVNAFDTKKYEIVKRTIISNDNVDVILNKIDNIRPRGSTNIHKALMDASNEINNILEMSPTSKINHIFMTDGESTDGPSDPTVLKSHVNTNVKNVFIGFGIDHDATLLKGVSSGLESDYYFIDKLESSGLVYGEILHGIVYKLLVKCEITIENGLIYDFKTNKWCSKLYIGDIISEANKTYNIISENPSICRVNIQGTLDNMVVLFPSRLNTEFTGHLDRHIYRQRTLQLLYRVNDYYGKMKADMSFRMMTPLPTPPKEETEKQLLKKELNTLFEEIKKYMEENNLNDDNFLKNLCDDLYICHRTFGTQHGNMFSNARQSSQGTQRIYTASAVHNLSEEHDNYEVSAFENTPYMTLQATQVMKDISGFSSDNTLTQPY